MRTTLCLILLFTFDALARGEGIHFERSSSWGSVQLAAGSFAKVQIGDTSTFVFTQDVLADFRLLDGQRLLIATGHLEFDAATGDFIATEYPFVYAASGSTIHRFTAADGILSVRKVGDHFKITTTSRTTIDDDGRPTILARRREQLSKLEGKLKP